MGRRKLRVYGDEDLDSGIEDWLRDYKWVNYEGAKELGFAGRSDDFHYQRAYKSRRVLLTYDDGFLNNSAYPLSVTKGVIVVKRARRTEAEILPFLKFLHWVWRDVILTVAPGPTIGSTKVSLSDDGFHYWVWNGIRIDEDYYDFD